MKTLCVVAVEAGRIEVGEYAIRDPLAGELLVETLFSTVSPGTELRCLRGREPNAGAFPLIPGYSLTGRVLRGAGSMREGDLVFVPGSAVMPAGITRAWGGHIGHAIVPVTGALKLPPGADPLAASALAMVAIALHGVSKARPLVGDEVLVVGLGLIGQLAVALLRLSGCRVAACDPLASRRALAEAAGARAYAPGADWHDEVQADWPEGFDILVDATGVPAVVTANLPLLRRKSWDNLYEPSAKLVFLASYPGPLALDYQETLFNREAEVVTCRNYLPHDLQRAARLIARGGLEVGPLLTHVAPAARAAEAFARLQDGVQAPLTVVFDWQAGGGQGPRTRRRARRSINGGQS